MKLYSWNVNGIRAGLTKGTFLKFIEEHQPDILCLQETKASQDQVEIDLPDYFEVWNSAKKKGYSGTAIFSKTEPLNVILNFPDEILKKYPELIDGYGHTNEEGRVTVAEFEEFFVATVYTPNSKGDLTRLELRRKSWDPAFLEYMQMLEKKKPVLFCGDLNVAHEEIDLANPKPNVGKHGFTNEEREGFSEFLAAGFVDTLRHFNPETPELYTWWTHWQNARARNVGWRIDYWLISKSFLPKLKDAKIHPDVMGSDHCPVSIEIED
ncbi:MAG: exodeoxyribonuclease III [Candidatus Nomurabacteria bacterium]|nr:MAG: exodeoxyribonuclease III [Candidatus Nomurabacteria bacterium]HRV76078.1 exodeoxyribonuclease III [Candidatus Saccharimonadales bacterium]